MTPEVISVVIAIAGFFFTCLGNAIILGMFLGGMKAEMRVTSDRLAKIEGMFTLVPRSVENVGKAIPLCMVYLVGVVRSFRRNPYRVQKGTVHPKRVHLASRGVQSRLDRASLFHCSSLCLAVLSSSV